MTPEGPLEADEFVCVRCGTVTQEHRKDGLGECAECVERAENGRSTTVEMICLEDDEDGEHVCYLPLGHDGEHVWTPFGNGRSATRSEASA